LFALFGFFALGCSEDFGASSGAGAQNGVTVSSSVGSGGSAGSSSRSSTGPGGGETSCPTLPVDPSAIFYTTLDDSMQALQPAIGDGTDAQDAGVQYVPALSNGGVKIPPADAWVGWLQAPANHNIDAATGTLDVCFRPEFDSDGDATYVLFHVVLENASWRLQKLGAQDSTLQMLAVNALGTTQTNFSPTFEQGKWYRLTLAWNFNAVLTERQVRLWIDGIEVDPAAQPGLGTFLLAEAGGDHRFYLGGGAGRMASAHGTFDELAIYPQPMAPP
jgi:hypothetical protein